MSTTPKKLIEHAWTGFERMVVPAQADALQRSEMQLAFFAGATAVLSAMLAISRDNVSDATGVEVLAGMHAEVREFSERLASVGQPSSPSSH